MNTAPLSPTDFAPIAEASIEETPKIMTPGLVRGRVVSMRAPTGRQLLCLRFIHSHTVEHGSPPTLREIGKQMGIRSTNGVNDHLRALERRGFIVRRDMITRSVRVTVEGLAVLGIDPSAHWDAPGAVPRPHETSTSLVLELRATRAENARLRVLLDRVTKACVSELPIVLASIRKELGE